MIPLYSCLGTTETVPLAFGTSGRRGLLCHLSQLEIAINVLAELQFLQTLAISDGGIVPGDTVYLAYDLRPSSTRLIDATPKRGELAQAVVWAIRQAGMIPCNLGAIPTPALACHALAEGKASIMVTGSHIPFDRNGYKTCTATGELGKAQEAPITRQVARVRECFYAESADTSAFGADGQFKVGSQPLPPLRADATRRYRQRYLEFFGAKALSGLNLLVYQHSAVGRELLPEILTGLGARVVTTGRSETFIPIDTENLDQARLETLQSLHDQVAGGIRFDAVVSTDGDSDRPLLLGVEADTGRLRFLPGDLLGLLTAQYLQADALVVPISCNDAVDRSPLNTVLQPKTRIGSPYVIAGMEQALLEGKRRVCGFEANGGFLTATDIEHDGRTLEALPTRDAVLPLVTVLASSHQQGLSVLAASRQLPQRYGHAALIANFPREQGQSLIRCYTPFDPPLQTVMKHGTEWVGIGQKGLKHTLSAEAQDRIGQTVTRLSRLFGSGLGFGELESIDGLDGLRLGFSNGDVAHIRPSGNADELRIYAVAATEARALQITTLAVAEPDGLLRRLASPDP